ncbi:MAG: transglycosylase SLT domain-containing protein [Ignavibacteria bacterium]|nr:transglycosylase SLT domain-containing protein [Ignavibacteria bacterium]
MDMPLYDNSLNNSSILQSKIDEYKHIQTTNVNKKALSDEEKAGFANASRGFEAIFINLMLKQMKQAMLSKDDNNGEEIGFGADTLESYADMLFAEEVSKIGKGIGIAESMYLNFTGERLPAVSSKEIPVNVPVSVKENNELLPKNNIPVNLNQNVNGNFIDRVKNRLNSYSEIITEASRRFNLPENIIKAIITAESAGIPNSTSPAGAKGLMQLMDGTALELGVKNPYEPYQNIMGGAKYLRQMLDYFGGDLSLALAAYNAGPGNVRKYGDIPPFRETQQYVKKVLRYADIFNENET